MKKIVITLDIDDLPIKDQISLKYSLARAYNLLIIGTTVGGRDINYGTNKFTVEFKDDTENE